MSSVFIIGITFKKKCCSHDHESKVVMTTKINQEERWNWYLCNEGATANHLIQSSSCWLG